jgi:hypothetical protein
MRTDLVEKIPPSDFGKARDQAANQLGRRNLTPDQYSLLRGRRYNRLKRQGARTDFLPSSQKVDTAEQLAKQHGVSPRSGSGTGKARLSRLSFHSTYIVGI